MLNYDISAYLAAQAPCCLGFLAYTVSHSNGQRSFTRSAADDIPSTFIDQSNLHYEASQIAGSYYEPGGLVPSIIRCHVFRILDRDGQQYEDGGGFIRYFSQVPVPRSTDDYNIVYRPIITMKYTSGGLIYQQAIPIASHMIVTKAEYLHDKSWNLTLQDELVVLDGHEFTPDQSVDIRTNADNAFKSCGFSVGIRNSTLIYNGSCYTSKTMSSRQALSYMLEVSGLFGSMYNGYIYAKYMNPNANSLVLDHEYVFDVKNLGGIFGEGQTISVNVFSDGAQRPVIKRPQVYICKDNPFVVQGNENAVHEAMLSGGRFVAPFAVTNTGTEITCLFIPTLEVGDRIRYEAHNLIISRIEWDGGAFCKLRCAEEDTSFR